MKTTDTFSTYNPILNFAYFIGAVGMGMFFMHPLFLLCNIILALAYGITINPVKCLKRFLMLLPVVAIITLVNPLLNTGGETVLFRIFGRPYTLEALMWGVVTGAMFCGVFLWFFCYNAVMTGDKFLYIFGKVLPSIALVLTMILRLIPNYARKTVQISSARACIGRSGKKTEDAMTVVSALTSWALEGGIVTADSMRSRGFGTGARTTFSIYRFDMRDVALLVSMVLLFALTVVCMAMGGARAEFIPQISITGIDNWKTAVGMAAYALFLAIPSALNITEAIKWRILRSAI